MSLTNNYTIIFFLKNNIAEWDTFKRRKNVWYMTPFIQKSNNKMNCGEIRMSCVEKQYVNFKSDIV